jgi:two-component system cell cycle response regulator
MPQILVVDDIAANIEILSAHLQDEGYQVLEAQSGQQALTLLQANPLDIDLILLDVMMPIMSGLDVLAHVKRNLDTEGVPVILVTANADDNNVAEGLDMGAFDYIIKPYSSVVLLARVRAALREKERLDLLEKWATTDPLTELYNRRHFFDLADRELERSRRLKSELSFIMLDIDFFKRVNDTYGHISGDSGLIQLANTLQTAMRKVDFCCRFGGEEFVLCLPDTSSGGALELAERIRKQVANTPVLTLDNQKIQIKISLGIASNNNDKNVEAILQRADAALYQAKEAGRNQTKVAKTH